MNRRNFIKSVIGFSLAIPSAKLMSKMSNDYFSIDIISNNPNYALNLINPIIKKYFSGPVNVKNYPLVGNQISDIVFYYNGKLKNIHIDKDSISKDLLNFGNKINLLSNINNPYLLRLSNIQARSAKNLNVIVDGRLTERIPVNENIEDMAITSNSGEIYLNMNNGFANVKGSNCKHKTCEKTGMINHPGESIVCIPSNISLQFDGISNGIDAFSY